MARTRPSRPTKNVVGQALRFTACGSLGVQLRRLARQKHWILDAILRDEGAEACGIFLLIGLFKRETDHFESGVTVLAVQLLKIGRFVVAVWAPASTDGDQQDFTLEARVGIGDDASVEIAKAES